MRYTRLNSRAVHKSFRIRPRARVVYIGGSGGGGVEAAEKFII